VSRTAIPLGAERMESVVPPTRSRAFPVEWSMIHGCKGIPARTADGNVSRTAIPPGAGRMESHRAANQKPRRFPSNGA